MNISTEAYGSGATIDSLYNEVNQLDLQYGELLEEESLTEEMSSLRYSIEEAMSGSPEAADYLSERGHDMLRDIRNKLNSAVEEQSRIIEESPSVAENASGETLDTTNKVTALPRKAERKADNALKKFNSNISNQLHEDFLLPDSQTINEFFMNDDEREAMYLSIPPNDDEQGWEVYYAERYVAF